MHTFANRVTARFSQVARFCVYACVVGTRVHVRACVRVCVCACVCPRFVHVPQMYFVFCQFNGLLPDKRMPKGVVLSFYSRQPRCGCWSGGDDRGNPKGKNKKIKYKWHYILSMHPPTGPQALTRTTLVKDLFWVQRDCWSINPW